MIWCLLMIDIEAVKVNHTIDFCTLFGSSKCITYVCGRRLVIKNDSASNRSSLVHNVYSNKWDLFITSSIHRQMSQLHWYIKNERERDTEVQAFALICLDSSSKQPYPPVWNAYTTKCPCNASYQWEICKDIHRERILMFFVWWCNIRQVSIEYSMRNKIEKGVCLCMMIDRYNSHLHVPFFFSS